MSWTDRRKSVTEENKNKTKTNYYAIHVSAELYNFHENSERPHTHAHDPCDFSLYALAERIRPAVR